MNEMVIEILREFATKQEVLDICGTINQFNQSDFLPKSSASPSEIIFGVINYYDNNDKIQELSVALKVFFDLENKSHPLTKKLYSAIQGLKYEGLVYEKIISYIVSFKLSPNFVGYIGNMKCPFEFNNKSNFNRTFMNKFSEMYEIADNNLLSKLSKKQINIIATQKIDNAFTFGDFIDLGKKTEDYDSFIKSFRLVLFQLVYSLVVMSYFKLNHNDLHLSNILVKRLDKKVDLGFNFNGNYYVLRDVEYIPFIFDWDFAYCKKLGKNEKLEKFCDYVNRCNEFNIRNDIYYLLCNLQREKLVVENIPGSKNYYKDPIYIAKEDEKKIIISNDMYNKLLRFPYTELDGIKNFKMSLQQFISAIGEKKFNKYFSFLESAIDVYFSLTKNYVFTLKNPKPCFNTTISKKLYTPLQYFFEEFGFFLSKKEDYDKCEYKYSFLSGIKKLKNDLYFNQFLKENGYYKNYRAKLKEYPKVIPYKKNERTLKV